MAYFDEAAAVVAARPEGDAVRLRLRAPAVAGAARPFQFVMARVPGEGFTLRRPLSVYDAARDELELLVRPLGEGTSSLAAAREGDRLRISGPFGRVFEPSADALYVAGGIGFAGVHYAMVAAFQAGLKPRLVYGARSSRLAYDVDALRAAGVAVTLVTDDGSSGEKGLVTDHLPPELPSAVIACGPRAMFRALRAKVGAGTTLYVLMEERMACGIGVCRACAVPVSEPAGAYRAVCVDGALFDAAALDWGRMEKEEIWASR